MVRHQTLVVRIFATLLGFGVLTSGGIFHHKKYENPIGKDTRQPDKVRALDARKRELGLRFPIEIDGGITLENVADAVRAGCEWIVTGSSIFHTGDPERATSEMRKAAEGARASYA